jgi:serine phosphatase RsbU (regulator of sigma subunit)
MGHGLAAAGVAAFAIAAYRHSRRSHLDLNETYDAMHRAVGEQFPDERYVTAVIAQLDLSSGRLSWISAGHPPPLVTRNGRTARILSAPPCLPLGVPLDGPSARVAEETLEPGDLVLFYTDGLTEARGRDGQPFATDGLSTFIEREALAGYPASETLRRLRQAIVGEQPEGLNDDATALLVEWNRASEASLLPPTVD